MFLWRTSPSCISIPCKCLLLDEAGGSSLSPFLLPFTRQEKSLTLFEGWLLFLAASLLKGMDSDRLAMCAICSCLCGDRMAPNILFFLGFFLFAPAGHGRCQSPWQSPNYRHGRRPCQTAPQAQPLFDCPTSVSMQDTQKKKQNYTVAKLEAQVCVCVQLK